MLTEPILKVLRVFSHLPHLVWTFPLSSFILTKFTGVKPPPDHSPHRTAEPWSNWKRWSRSGSNWTMVWFISSVTTLFCKVLILAQNTGCYNVALIYKSSPVHSKILYTPWWCAWCSCLSALSGLAPHRQAVRPPSVPITSSIVWKRYTSPLCRALMPARRCFHICSIFFMCHKRQGNALLISSK